MLSICSTLVPMNRASSNSDTPAAIANDAYVWRSAYGRAVSESCSAHGGRPLVAPPRMQVQVPAAVAGEQQRRVEPGRDRRKRLDGCGWHRHRPERPRLLPVELHLRRP